MAIDDTVDDDDERVELSFDLATLQQTDERVLAGDTTDTVVAIIDDDDPIVRVSFAQSSYEVDEGGTVTVTVKLDADPERTVVIPITWTQERRDRRRLLGRAGQRQLQCDREIEDIQLRRHTGHAGRRRRERAAGLRFDAGRAGLGGDAEHDDGGDHRRRRP